MSIKHRVPASMGSRRREGARGCWRSYTLNFNYSVMARNDIVLKIINNLN